MQDQTAIYESLLNQQVLEEILNRLDGEVKVLILGVCQYVVEEACEGDDELSDEATDHIDAVLLSLGVPDVVYPGCPRHVLVLGGHPYRRGSYFLQEDAYAVAFPRRGSLLLSEPLLLLLLLLQSEQLLLVLLPSLVLLDHGVSVGSGLSTHAEVEEVVEVVSVLAQRGDVKLNLSIELGDEGTLEGVVKWLAEGALVDHDLESIALEEVEEILGGSAGENFLLSHHLLALVGPLLQTPALVFIYAALASGLHALRLDQFGFLYLEEQALVLGELFFLVVLDGLDLGEFDSLADEHLEDGLGLEVKIEEVFISIINLNMLRVALRVRHEYGRRGTIDVVVRLELLLIHHVFVVAELFPLVLRLHVNDLLALVLLLLHHLHALHLVVLPLADLLRPLLAHHLLLLLPLH